MNPNADGNQHHGSSITLKVDIQQPRPAVKANEYQEKKARERAEQSLFLPGRNNPRHMSIGKREEGRAEKRARKKQTDASQSVSFA